MSTNTDILRDVNIFTFASWLYAVKIRHKQLPVSVLLLASVKGRGRAQYTLNIVLTHYLISTRLTFLLTHSEKKRVDGLIMEATAALVLYINATEKSIGR